MGNGCLPSNENIVAVTACHTPAGRYMVLHFKHVTDRNSKQSNCIEGLISRKESSVRGNVPLETFCVSQLHSVSRLCCIHLPVHAVQPGVTDSTA